MKETAETESISLMKRRLFTLVKESAYLRSPPEEPFKLASGGTGYVYFDAKQITQDPEGVTLVAKIILKMIRIPGLKP